jgi:transcriptional regulator with XRE-family HTH domain
MSQDEVARLLGAGGKCRRRTMTRYEKGDRNPEVSRTKKIANILNVSYYAIKIYDYKDSLDVILMDIMMTEMSGNTTLKKLK